MNRLLILKKLCFIVAFFIFFVPGIVFADWSSFRFNNSHSGSIPYEVGDLSPLKWTSSNIGTIKTVPVVDSNGDIYIGTQNGKKD